MKLNIKTFLLVAVIASFALTGTTSCKAKKEAAEKARIEAERAATAVAELNALLIDETSTVDQLQTKLDAIKLRKIENAEVKGLIDLNQKRIDGKREEIRKKEEAEKKKEEVKKEVILKTDEQLDLYLQQIAKAPTAAEANALIEKVYDMFSSKTADVLIIISNAGGEPDYDKPTNIQTYLNYVKDQKLYSKKVYNLEMDNNGKIKLLELLNR